MKRTSFFDLFKSYKDLDKEKNLKPREQGLNETFSSIPALVPSNLSQTCLVFADSDNFFNGSFVNSSNSNLQQNEEGGFLIEESERNCSVTVRNVTLVATSLRRNHMYVLVS